MKITGVESALLRIPTAKPIALSLPTHDLVVATIRTDEGLSGFGYSLVFGSGGSEAVLAYLRSRLGPYSSGRIRSSSSGCGRRCSESTAASSDRVSPPTR